MSQFLFQVAYTSDSWAKQVRDQANVLERIQPLLAACDGRADSCFYAFGDCCCLAVSMNKHFSSSVSSMLSLQTVVVWSISYSPGYFYLFASLSQTVLAG